MEYIYDVWLSNLNVVINNGRFAKFSPDASWGIDSNRFKQSKFYFVTKGGFEITIEGKEYTAQAGDWFFVPANALHSCKNNTVTGLKSTGFILTSILQTPIYSIFSDCRMSYIQKTTEKHLHCSKDLLMQTPTK